jgi:hypothetical protein
MVSRTIAERPPMKKPMLIAAVVLLAACGTAKTPLPRAAPGTGILEVRGAVKGAPVPLSERELRALPQRAIRGVDPATGREATWMGVPLAVLVNDRVERKKGADTVIVRTADKAAVPIPITLVRQLHAVLADRADGERVPLVVAWPNAEQIGLTTDPRQPLWWAHDVVALEIVDFQAALGRALWPPEGAPDGARLGSDTFASRCIACHALRGAGGQKGPDLTEVATRLSPEAFRKHLETHPGWAQRGYETPGPEAALDLWSFLRSVSMAPRPEPRSPDVRGGESALMEME